MSLVSDYSQVRKNSLAFSDVGNHKITMAYEVFAFFQHWYYFPDIGEGVFAPSKFIGYQDTTLHNYDGSGHGGDTEEILKQWFRKCDRKSEEFGQYITQLQSFAKSNHRKINAKVTTGTGGIHTFGYLYPDEAATTDFTEGGVKQDVVNAYERNPEARKKCLEKHGYNCKICETSFEEIYGDIGKNFINVHHLFPISKIPRQYKINPIKHLCPVCPNCHAMLHQTDPPLMPEELATRMKEMGVRRSHEQAKS